MMRDEFPNELVDLVLPSFEFGSVTDYLRIADAPGIAPGLRLSKNVSAGTHLSN